MNNATHDHFLSVRRVLVGAIAATALLGAGLVGLAPGSGAAAHKPAVVKVKLIEYKIKLKPSTVTLKAASAGKVKMVAANKGSMEHEMVVVRADSVEALPLDADGVVVEDQIPEADFMGEIGEYKQGRTKSKVFTLTPGTYVVFCNIDVDYGGTIINHFKQDMHAVLTVK